MFPVCINLTAPLLSPACNKKRIGDCGNKYGQDWLVKMIDNWGGQWELMWDTEQQKQMFREPLPVKQAEINDGNVGIWYFQWHPWDVGESLPTGTAREVSRNGNWTQMCFGGCRRIFCSLGQAGALTGHSHGLSATGKAGPGSWTFMSELYGLKSIIDLDLPLLAPMTKFPWILTELPFIRTLLVSFPAVLELSFSNRINISFFPLKLHFPSLTQHQDEEKLAPGGLTPHLTKLKIFNFVISCIFYSTPGCHFGVCRLKALFIWVRDSTLKVGEDLWDQQVHPLTQHCRSTTKPSS